MDSPKTISAKPATSIGGEEDTYETGDDDTLSFLDEFDTIRGDIKQKKKSAAGRLLRDAVDGRGSFGNDIPVPLSDDEKTALAIGVSVASIPGAYDSDNNRITRKLTEDQILEIRRLRVVQKGRYNFQQPDRGLEECEPDAVDPIDELQAKMQGYEAYVVDENARAEKVKEVKLKKRRKFMIAIVVGVVAIVCVVTGVFVGRGSGSDSNSNTVVSGSDPSSVPSTAPSFDAFTGLCAESTPDDAYPLSDRYAQLRSTIGASFPNMTTAIDTPMSIERVSLCWLAEIDTFQSTGQDELIQRFILALIYFRLVQPGGPVQMADADLLLMSQTWLTDERTCDWSFVDCGSIEEVQGIQLADIGLVGRIPTEISLLTNLLHLDMSNNQLSGEMPSELWGMTQLETLRFSWNQLNGTLPAELIQLRELVDLRLHDNKFTGTLPPLADLSHMKELDFGGNPLEGLIPDLSALTNLGKKASKYIAS
jgi:hypothetical protein